LWVTNPPYGNIATSVSASAALNNNIVTLYNSTTGEITYVNLVASVYNAPINYFQFTSPNEVFPNATGQLAMGIDGTAPTGSNIVVTVPGECFSTVIICDEEVTFNGDTSSIYTSHQLYGDGSSATSNYTLNFSSMLLGDGNYGTTTGGTFGLGIADILDYTNTNKFKTVRHMSGVDINGTVAGYGGRAGLGSGVWRSTAAISSITLVSNSLINFAQYSSFVLYGVKA
jgi:hypothetical protein